ncbi:helix-turn-helix transcriptional regulator [Pedobacter hiemivivus]|uniref:Helix-turn-helix transcriptional regulator n=1 Tax=Pedobacter hiemivivus TaxID=2530454 RepID=A0A4V5PBM4_9SPHI|nr:AraC family transcriptional regulator [Pedobacter hiemivivus]TKC55946.1 helix-turn-helix transcriptional regulator [Pedobacter hiemivivus]
MLKEITPLTNGDCFTIFERKKHNFDFPLHYHEEMELNFISNACGARRVVGDHIEEIGDIELVLIGSNLPHVWETHNLNGREIHEVTIQFHKDLFDEKFLRRNQLRVVREMFEKSKCGILFSKETAQLIGPKLVKLNKKHGFDSVLELMSILHDLSTSRNMRTLSDSTFSHAEFSYNSRRVEKVMEYINFNFDKQVSLAEVARIANMTEVSFSRFFKSRTGISFTDSLTEIRLGHASRKLIDTTESVAEVAYNCGFNNISNFNRIFKKKKGCTPKEFRDNLSGNRVFV